MTDFETLPTFNPELTGLAEDRKAELADVLANLVPECVEEGELNLEKLKHALALADPNEEAEAFERFELNWAGKSQAKRLASKRTTATLVPVVGDGVNEDTTQNLLIEGDNLEVLKVLKDTYAGKVDMIYIDPPYNIDVDGVYEDDFEEPLQSYLKRTGAVDEHQHITESEGSTTRQSGRKHSRWLSMMYPRLQLMKQLLIRGGVICISIDDKEVANLRLLMDEIFGEDNFVSRISVKSASTASYRSINTCPVNVSELVLIYTNGVSQNLEPVYTESSYSEDYSHIILNRGDSPDKWSLLSLNEYVYQLEGVNEKEFKEKHKGYWKERRLSLKSEIAKKESEKIVSLNTLQKPSQSLKDLLTISKHDPSKVYYTENSYFYKGRSLAFFNKKMRKINGKLVPSEILTNIFTHVNYLSLGHESEGVPFPNSQKPLGLLQTLTSLYKHKKAVILDCFAGSGTTGHAVMKLNAEDGGQRQYICVQVPEPLSPTHKNQSTACEFLDSIGKPRTIAEITKERLRRAGASIKEAHPESPVDVGFKVFKLADSTVAPKHATYTHRTDFENEAHALATQNEARLRYALQTDPYAIAWEVALKHGYALTEQLVPVSLGTLTGYAVFPPKPTERHALHQPKLLVLPTGVLEDKDAVWVFTHALQAVFPTHHFVLWEGLFQGDDAVKRSVMDAVDTFKTQLTDLKGNPLKNNTLRIEVIRL